MNERKRESLILEILTALLFILFLLPFAIVLINSAKDAFTVTDTPMSLPDDWLQLFRNIADIWTSPNVQYRSSFMTSVVITIGSLAAITFFHPRPPGFW
jgi:raffinose/stachyose/melibiose transport system permease protein